MDFITEMCTIGEIVIDATLSSYLSVQVSSSSSFVCSKSHVSFHILWRSTNFKHSLGWLKREISQNRINAQGCSLVLIDVCFISMQIEYPRKYR